MRRCKADFGEATKSVRMDAMMILQILLSLLDAYPNAYQTMVLCF